jgi:hypothetical protein
LPKIAGTTPLGSPRDTSHHPSNPAAAMGYYACKSLPTVVGQFDGWSRLSSLVLAAGLSGDSLARDANPRLRLVTYP